MYYIYKEIYLDTLEKKYKTIIVMDYFPDILKPYVKRIKLNKLSIKIAAYSNANQAVSQIVVLCTKKGIKTIKDKATTLYSTVT